MEVVLLLLLLAYFGNSCTVFLSVLLGVVYVTHKIIKKQHYWKRRHVKYVKPTFLIGQIDILKRKPMWNQVFELYQHFPEERYYGFFLGLRPFLVIKDPELIKQITIKHFDHFMDRNMVVNPETDPYMSKNLLAITGDTWREWRSTLSPIFTSSKIKMLYGLFDEICLQFVDFLKKPQEIVVEVEIKDLLTRFSNDIIATTAFGLKCNSLENVEDEFYQLGLELFNLDGKKIVQMVILNVSIKLAMFLRFSIIPKHVAEYFGRIIKETIRVREEKQIKRPDLIHLLMEAQKSSRELQVSSKMHRKPVITNDDIVSQAMLFFLGGFQTFSVQTQFLFYELAKNKAIQERLRVEIESVETNYENVQSLKYLDMVISETLRKWPANYVYDRRVTKAFTIEPLTALERPLTLQKGDIMVLLPGAIHRDPKYFQNPENFDPERFSTQNRGNINTTMYMPFGAGPRGCLAPRFALLEMKLLIVHVLKEFEIITTDRTPLEELVFDKNEINMHVEGGLWLGFRRYC